MPVCLIFSILCDIFLYGARVAWEWLIDGYNSLVRWFLIILQLLTSFQDCFNQQTLRWPCAALRRIGYNIWILIIGNFWGQKRGIFRGATVRVGGECFAYLCGRKGYLSVPLSISYPFFDAHLSFLLQRKTESAFHIFYFRHKITTFQPYTQIFRQQN